MSDAEDVQLPLPSRAGVRAGGGGGGGGLRSARRSSRKVVDGLRTASSRRLNYSSFTSNGSRGGGGETEGSAVGIVNNTGSKACSACGIQFTWRMRRHHCRACRKAVCDPCSKERLLLIGGDSKRHRVCHPCLKRHLATGRTREDRVYPQVVPSSGISSPFDSRNTSRDISRNASRDVSRHGTSTGSSLLGLATYKEDVDPAVEAEEADLDGVVSAEAVAAPVVTTNGAEEGMRESEHGPEQERHAHQQKEKKQQQQKGQEQAQRERRGENGDRAGGATEAAAATENTVAGAAAADAMAAAWTGHGDRVAEAKANRARSRSEVAAAETAEVAPADTVAAAEASAFVAVAPSAAPPIRAAAVVTATAMPTECEGGGGGDAGGGTGGGGSAVPGDGRGPEAALATVPRLDQDWGYSERSVAPTPAPSPSAAATSVTAAAVVAAQAAAVSASPPEPEVQVAAPTEETAGVPVKAGGGVGGGGAVAVPTAVAVGSVKAGPARATAQAQGRPPLGAGVRADPASHQHKRPVQGAKGQNPLALPWFTSKHASPCATCEDLWKVAWSAREDFLRDLKKAESGKDYQLVASSGDNLRLYAAGNMFWGGQAIRLRVEMEVAVPIGFAMRWLASLTARGGVYYPYSDTAPCDIVESDSGALSVSCAHWPTQLSGARRCTVLRYVSEDGSPPPGIREDAAAGRAKDARPTIVFTTIDHPIMREWAAPGVDVEVFPSGLVLDKMDTPDGPVTRVHGLIGWDNKGALQHIAKMNYMTERADRLDRLGEHLRAMEQGYLEQVGTDGSRREPSLAKNVGNMMSPGNRSRTASTAPTPPSSRKRSMGGPKTSLSPSASSPRTSASPLPTKNNHHEKANGNSLSEGESDDDRGRMTSRAGPLSPNRGGNLIGGAAISGGDGEVEAGLNDFGYGYDQAHIRRKTTSSGGGLADAAGVRVGGSGDWTPPPGHKRIPSPARAAELEAEVGFLTRQLSVRQTLEERLRVSESDKARLITKLATAQADYARRAETLEAMVRDMSEKLSVRDEQISGTLKKLGDAEKRAMTAQRDLRVARDALRVQADLAKAAGDAVTATAALSASPGSTSRFPASNHDLPLAASPALRAPPPVRWGSGPMGPSGGSEAGGGEWKSKGAAGGVEVGGGEGGGEAGCVGKTELLVGRTQEMGVRFALDTLRYSEDQEVVVFMLHLVQGLRHEAEGCSTAGRRGSGFGGGGGPKAAEQAAPSSGPAGSEDASTVARVLFNSQGSSVSGTPHSRGRRNSWGSGDEAGGLSELAVLLIERACGNEEVANFLFWYLKLEAEADPVLRPMYLRVRNAFAVALAEKNANFAASLKAAEAYMSAISEAHRVVKQQGGRAPKKTARLKSILAEECLHIVPDLDASGIKRTGKGASTGKAGQELKVIPLPLDPNAVVLGLRPATAYTFPSAMSPCVVEFVLSNSVGMTFKGDDLLLEPSEDEGPRLVTGISAAGMQSWSGGPLPRQYTGPGGAQIVHVHVDPWEREGRGDDGSEGPAPTEETGGAAVASPLEAATATAATADDDDDESFLDRRRISASVGSLVEEEEDEDADTFAAVQRNRDLSASAVDVRLVTFNNSASKKASKSATELATGEKAKVPMVTAGGGAGGKPARTQRSALARQASSDLTKLRLWEQMQVLGAASRERGSYLAIFKNGEDVRQDQLAVHMVSLMDRQLKEAGLDLRLKSYRVLATGLTTGMIEFVPGSVPMSAVLAKHNNSVLEFLRHHNSDPAGPLSMKREALDNFTRSCAGSCVVTYLLGVGDRHLDNLMLLPEGVLFHIDFGYLFGKDPKLMPPPFRLTKEMVEAMGGPEAPHYTVFKSLCCQAYRHLRKSAHQYLNLLSLMSGAGIKDLSDDPAAVLQLVQDRFKLELTDEQADAHFLGLVSQSLTALAPRVLEVMHQIRVAAR